MIYASEMLLFNHCYRISNLYMAATDMTLSYFNFGKCLMSKSTWCTEMSHFWFVPCFFVCLFVVFFSLAGPTVGENPEELNHVWLLSGAWRVRHKRSFPAGKHQNLQPKVWAEREIRTFQRVVDCPSRGSRGRSFVQWANATGHLSLSSGPDTETAANFRPERRRVERSDERHSRTGWYKLTFLSFDLSWRWLKHSLYCRLQQIRRQVKM